MTIRRTAGARTRASPSGGFAIRDPRVAIRFEPDYYDTAAFAEMFGRADFDPGEFLMDFSCTVVAHAALIPMDVSLRLQGLGLRLIRARGERGTADGEDERGAQCVLPFEPVEMPVDEAIEGGLGGTAGAIRGGA